jgi:L-lactate dehydrogenase complex protein LldG
MNARADILARLRRRQKRDRAQTERARRDIDLRLATIQIHPRPLIRGELHNAFIERAEGAASTTEMAEGREEIPMLVASYLSAQSLPLKAAIWPEFADLDWSQAGIMAVAEGAREGDEVGITGAFCGIAETGTLMLSSGPLQAATTSLLPETHIALLAVSRIVGSMEDAFSLARNELRPLPRAVNFISGPSRTGDIEQTIVLGAHGPCRVHIILY